MTFFIDGNREITLKIVKAIEDITEQLEFQVEFLEKESDELIKLVKDTTVFKLRDTCHRFNNIINKNDGIYKIRILNISPVIAKTMMLLNKKTRVNDLAVAEVKKNFNVALNTDFISHTLVLETPSDDEDINEAIRNLISKIDNLKKDTPKQANMLKDVQIVRDESLHTTLLEGDKVISENAICKIARILYNKVMFQLNKQERINTKNEKKQAKLRRKTSIKKKFNKTKNFKDSNKSKRKPKDNRGNTVGHHTNKKEYKKVQHNNYKKTNRKGNRYKEQ